MTAGAWRRVAKWGARTALMLVLGFVLFGISVLIVIPRATHGTALTVLTGSMTPGIPVGSVVIDRPVDPGTLHVGDIATYQVAPGKAEYITHRIIKIDTSKSPTQFTFKGDANRGPDIKPVPATAIRGKVWFHVPYLGGMRDAIQTKGGVAGVAIVLLTGYAIFQVAGAYKDRRNAKPTSTPTDMASAETTTPVGTPEIDLATVRQRLAQLNALPADELDMLSPQAVLRLVDGALLDNPAAFDSRMTNETAHTSDAQAHPEDTAPLDTLPQTPANNEISRSDSAFLDDPALLDSRMTNETAHTSDAQAHPDDAAPLDNLRQTPANSEFGRSDGPDVDDVRPVLSGPPLSQDVVDLDEEHAGV